MYTILLLKLKMYCTDNVVQFDPSVNVNKGAQNSERQGNPKGAGKE